MTGEGEIGANGGPKGDLYIVLNVDPHEFFERENEDIYCEVPITLSQAVMGAEIEVPTLEVVAKVKIPAGTQSHASFRLKGKGIVRLGTRRKGDQIVVVNLKVPKKLTQRQKELMEEFATLESDAETSSFTEKIKNLFAGSA